MSSTTNDLRHLYEEIQKKAREKVNHKKGVYIHLTASISVAIILVVLSFVIGRPFMFWLLFPILPLALGFLIHYVVVFGIPGTQIMSEEWEDEQMSLEMWKMARKKKLDLGDAEKPDELELQRLEKLRNTWSDEDFV